MRDPIKVGNDKIKVYPLYSENLKFDYDSILKTRTASIKFNEDDNTVTMNDPYSNRKKVSFEHAWLYDPVVRAAINTKVDFIIGERPITVLDTKKEFTASNEKAAEAFNNIVGNNTLQEMKTYIDNLNASLNFHQSLKAAVVNMKIYGRSAIHIEKYLDTEPADLKVLNPQKLGEVILDNDSWNLKCVRYTGRPEEDDLLYADELIYFTNVDYNVVPDSIGYGYSEVDPIVHISECNRIIDATDLKEINAKLWGAFGIIKFLETKDPTAMRQFLEQFKPGTWTATDANIEIDIKQINSSLKELIDERNENDLRIIRGIRVPSFLMGFEKITNRSCYVDTTETLTENGWKHYWEIQHNEKIATYNPNTKCIEYHIPNSLHVYPYEGDIIHFKSRTQDIKVTPDHTMFVKTQDKCDFKKRKAYEIENFNQVKFLASADYNEGKEQEIYKIGSVQYNNGQNIVEQILGVNMDIWLEFLGYYLSEGSRTYENFKDYGRHYKIEISQNIVKNVEKANKIESCLNKMVGFNFKRYSHSKGKAVIWIANNKQLYKELESTTGGNHLTKTIPRYIYNLSYNQRKILFNALMLGDGHYRMSQIKEYDHYIYITTSKQLADDVQELAFTLGYITQIREEKPKQSNRNIKYTLCISRGRTVTVQNNNIQREYYKGNVYCFNVPNHLFVTRLNGKVAIQGNTVRAVLEAWKQSTINPERTIIKNIVEPQWLDTLVANYLGVRKIKDVYVKVKQEFQDIVFETVKDLSDSYLPLFEQGLISGYQLLRLLDLDYLADETKALQSKLMQEKQQLITDLNQRINEITGQMSPKGDMEQSIDAKIIKSQLLSDIDNRMGTRIDTAINDFIKNAINKKLAKDSIEKGLVEAGL